MIKIIQKPWLAWCVFFLVLAVVIMSVTLVQDWTTQWWTLADEFFAFMMVFSHLVSIYVAKINRDAGNRLEIAAAIFGVLMIIALVVEYFLMN